MVKENQLAYAGELIDWGGYLTDSQEAFFLRDKVGRACFRCVFWEAIEPPTFNSYYQKSIGTWTQQDMDALGGMLVYFHGRCKRYPPTSTVFPDDGVESHFPETNYSEWCGEFKQDQ